MDDPMGSAGACNDGPYKPCLDICSTRTHVAISEWKGVCLVRCIVLDACYANDGLYRQSVGSKKPIINARSLSDALSTRLDQSGYRCERDPKPCIHYFDDS